MLKISHRSKVILSIVAGALAFALCAGSITWAVCANKTLKEYRLQTEEEARQKKIEAEANIRTMQSEADALQNRLVALSAELAILKANDRYQHLTAEIENLERELSDTAAAYENKIAALDALIRDYETVYIIDVVEQGKIISQLLALLSEGVPKRQVVTEPEENPDPDAPPKEPEYFDARVALYYQDLTTGYTFAYGENDIFPTASLIKLTYVWSLLKRVSAEEDIAARRAAEYKEAELAREKAEAEQAEQGAQMGAAHPDETTDDTAEPPERIFPDYIFDDPIFDLSDTVILDKETMMVEGSGGIQHMEDGTEFTYRELVTYALTQSDNIAFDLLVKRFGYSDFYKDATAIGVKTVRQSYYRMTAKEGGLFLNAIYDFIKTDARYGAYLKSCMLNSAHTVMIPHGVYPTPAAHKYGWDIDAYHDMAIVYNAKPYVLVFLSDLDLGSNSAEVNAYVKQVIALVNKLHNNYYKR